MTEPLRVGIVGTGDIAESVHLPAYDANPATRVVGLAEIDPDRRRRVAEQYDVRGQYENHGSLFEEANLDVVSICSPPFTHEEIFTDAAERGIHILCEKPVSTSLASARRMQAAAESAGIVTQMGHALRYMGNYRRSRQMLQNGLLGDVSQATTVYHSSPPPAGWYYDADLSGGGVVVDKFPHVLDFYIGLFGKGSVSVESAELRYARTNAVEDIAEVTLDVGGTDVDISAGWTHQRWNVRTTVVGVEGMLEFNDETLEGTVQGEWVYFKRGQRPLIQLGPLFQTWLRPSETPHTDRIDDFVAHVRRGDYETLSPIERGVEVTRIIDDIYQTGGVSR
ncbi:Gfo/Idh/MocA family protein [Halobium salinum]|uniref:Gfo/Idh/MocA family protein n=1 Tax=Halobium salinum TaxID=1364940 RepID=A0ABD5PA85_9EURY|nr:Gfo/Idh/MocA family oxidoreductase [Halobium salinum]